MALSTLGQRRESARLLIRAPGSEHSYNLFNHHAANKLQAKGVFARQQEHQKVIMLLE